MLGVINTGSTVSPKRGCPPVLALRLAECVGRACCPHARTRLYHDECRRMYALAYHDQMSRTHLALCSLRFLNPKPRPREKVSRPSHTYMHTKLHGYTNTLTGYSTYTQIPPYTHTQIRQNALACARHTATFMCVDLYIYVYLYVCLYVYICICVRTHLRERHRQNAPS